MRSPGKLFPSNFRVARCCFATCRRLQSVFVQTLLLPAAAPGAVARAAALLAAGEPVGLPTETVYGLAADALNPAAVARVFEAKERPFFDPLIVHLPPDGDWLERLTAPPPSAAAREVVVRLAARFWPGPLTILLPRRVDVVLDLVTAGSPLVAVRRSAHPVFTGVLAAFGRPLAAPSANRFGRISPTEGAHVVAELGGRIPLVLDAGPTAHGLESTVVFPQPDGSLRILRPGPVTTEMLAEVAPVAASSKGRPESAAAPGQTASHYAPRTPFHLEERASLRSLLNLRPKRRGFLCWQRLPKGIGHEPAEILSAAGDLREAAATLFAKMRRLDEAGLEQIWAEPVPETGLGVAINERLRRAAAAKW